MDVSSLIPIADTGFYLKGLVDKSVQAHTSCWVRPPAHYCQGEPKLNLIMDVGPGDLRLPLGVDGHIQNSGRWVHILQINCDKYVFRDFVESILSDLENNLVPGNGNDGICLLWDILSLHKTAYVTHIIEGCLDFNRFMPVDWPPYRPKIASIEYVFCEVAVELSGRVKMGWSTQVTPNDFLTFAVQLELKGNFIPHFYIVDTIFNLVS